MKMAKRTTEGFGAFVRRIRKEKRLSLADVSKQSALFGMKISTSYVNRIERNPKLKPTVDTLKALAHGLGVPLEEVLTRATRTLTPDEADELTLMSRYRELSPPAKSDLRDIIELFHSRSTKQSSATRHL